MAYMSRNLDNNRRERGALSGCSVMNHGSGKSNSGSTTNAGSTTYQQPAACFEMNLNCVFIFR